MRGCDVLGVCGLRGGCSFLTGVKRCQVKFEEVLFLDMIIIEECKNIRVHDGPSVRYDGKLYADL